MKYTSDLLNNRMTKIVKENINICYKKVKKNLNNLSNTYNLISDNTFTINNSNVKFKILKRKKTSKYKTFEYLALFEGKKFKSYISSLYLISNKDNKIEYNFDYEGIDYALIMDLNERIVMIKLGQNWTSGQV